jgi:SAM-dependent methyltransferase
MDKLVEQQREHFNRISGQYFSARSDPNHQLLKSLIWKEFFARHPGLGARVRRVLEPMCGMAEGFKILSENLGTNLDYVGFDYSDKMVEIARAEHPNLRLEHGDVTAYRPAGEPFDMIVLIGGLHHVFSRTAEVLRNLREALKPGGLFLSLEPTHDNPIARRARQKIYASNDLFDEDSEQGFEYRDLQEHFAHAGYRRIDEVYPGLLAYVLYYNPDAFPALNVGGQGLVRSAFALDRMFWDNAVGRKLSFATISLWERD